MKNLKNMTAAAGLMAVMAFGAVSAKAALLNSDKTTSRTKIQCADKNDGVLGKVAGIISGLTGISIHSLIFSDAPCNTDKEIPADEEILIDGYRKC